MPDAPIDNRKKPDWPEPRLLVTGRKGSAFQIAVLVLVLLILGAGVDPQLVWDLTESELEKLLMALAGVLATFCGGNAFEHHTKKETAPPPSGD